MSNTITGLIPELYSARDVISRELTGLIPSVTRDMTFERAAVGQTVRSPVAPAAFASDISPNVTPPDDGDQVIGSVDMTITKSRRVPVRWEGEEERGLDNNGAGINTILRDQFAQAMRTLVNEVEFDLAAHQVQFSRAYGSAGTTPFGTAGNFTDASYAAKLLKDNGAPPTGNMLVLDTSAGANLIGVQSRTDIAGQDRMLRQGVLLDTAGFAIRESAQIAQGFGSNVITGTVTVTGINAVGVTSIGVTTAAASGVIAIAGDIITFAGDSEKYIISADVTIGAATTGTVVLAAPGLRKATTAAQAISGVAASSRSMAFAPSAIALATRAPALPKQGDMATARRIITDPVSGLSFEVSIYPQYRQVQYEFALAWGSQCVKTEHGVLLLG